MAKASITLIFFAIHQIFVFEPMENRTTVRKPSEIGKKSMTEFDSLMDHEIKLPNEETFLLPLQSTTHSQPVNFTYILKMSC